MLWLGMILPVAFVPGWTGASIPTQYPVLWSALPFLMLWRHPRLGYAHLAGICFISYAALSLTWAAEFRNAVFGLAVIAVWAMSFWLGSAETSLTQLWKGLGLGIAVNSAAALSQYLGHGLCLTDHNILSGVTDNYSPGLLWNTTVSGAVASLILVGLISHRLWFYIPGVLPSLVLSFSRGAWLALAVGVAARYLNWKVCLGLLVAVSMISAFQSVESDNIRLSAWVIAIRNLSWFGLGPESFHQVWVQHDTQIIQMQHAHNDYLEIVFEHGIGAIFIFGIIAAALLERRATDWPVFVAFACLALFWFPLYSPISAFIGAVVAGHLVRDRYLLRGDSVRGRPDLVSGYPQQRSASFPDRAGDVPVELRV